MPVDEELFKRARRGNTRAAIAVMSECYPQVFRLAYSLSGRGDVGRGVVDYVLRSGLRVLPTWTSEVDPLRWCRHHTVLTVRRASKHQPDLANDTLIRAAKTDNQYYPGFVRAVRALPFQQREAFILTHGEEWDARLLAVAMDCSIEAANNHLREATRALSALGGDLFAYHTAQLAQAYRSLTPDRDFVLHHVQRKVRRWMWPRKLMRVVRVVITLAAIAAIALFVWKIYPQLVY